MVPTTCGIALRVRGLRRWLYRRHKDQRTAMQMVQQEQYNEELAQYERELTRKNVAFDRSSNKVG